MTSFLTPWRLVVLILIVAAIGIAPTFWLLWPKWVDSFTYSHGLLVVPICAWLLWEQRHRINAEKLERAYWAAPVLLGLSFVWTLSFAASIEIGASATMPLILLVAVTLAAGRRIGSIVAIPILLLYSAIPVWDSINGILQSMTTSAVSIILGVIQVPAFIQGNVVQIPSGVFEIAGGCSGLHFFIVGLTLASIYGYRYLGSVRNRIVLMFIAAVFAVAMNWIRVATIITAGHLTNMQSYLVKVDHYYFGWVLFAVLLIPFFVLARWLERREGDGVGDSVAGGERFPANASLVIVSTVCVIALLPVLVWGRLVQNEAAPMEIQLPALVGWTGPGEPLSDWRPVYHGADGEAQATYLRDGQSVEIYVNWYQSQAQGRELIGYGNSVAGRNVSQHYDRNYVDVTAGNDAKLPKIREILTSSQLGGRRLTWYQFVVGDVGETEALRAKLRQGLRSVVGLDGTGLVAVSTVCDKNDTGCSDARQLLKKGFDDLQRTRNHHE